MAQGGGEEPSGEGMITRMVSLGSWQVGASVHGT